MKLYKLLFFIIAVSIYSCEYDYEVDGEFTPKVVVNSVINPDSTIKATLFWSTHVYYASVNLNKVVYKFTAKLYENNSVIFKGEGINGVLSTDVYPKEGATYRLEVDVPEYGKLSAETSIPLKPTSDLTYVGVKKGWRPYFHFSINKIIPNSDTRSVIIRVRNFTRFHLGLPILYANNAFCDQFNTVVDMFDSELKGSNVGYEHYIRIPYKNIDKVIPLKFSLSMFSTDLNIGDDEYETGYRAITEIIAPSNEYDKYNKSAYQQSESQQSESISIFSDTYAVYSNIENGLGIFAGYSSTSLMTNIR